MKTIEDLIREQGVFQGMSDAQLALIAGCGSNVAFKPGDLLFVEGKEANAFFLIRQGKVAIEINSPDRGATTIQTAGAGELVGWSWIFPPYSWQFDGRAIETVRATSFDGACLRQKCEADPHLGYELMKRFAQVVSSRLQATRLQLLDIYGNR